MKRTIVAGAIGNCVHVAGVFGFLRAAEAQGYNTVFLGAATSIDDFVEAIRENDPEIVGISYRLTPDVAEMLLVEFWSTMKAQGLDDRRFVFGGTPPVCAVAEGLGWFEKCFNGLENPDEVSSFLGGRTHATVRGERLDNLVARIDAKRPYPLLRHHFGLPDMRNTLSGIRRIADSGVLDVISIAPDQNAQESFFRSEEMNPWLDGAGGAPIRSESHLKAIRRAGRRGNYPLLRIYSGTRDLVKWADLATKTVHNAWGAIPLCWYSALDGRSTRTPREAIHENQEAMRWYGERGIPVEVNESHHWSLRDAHDTIAVVMAYLAAYNAKRMGVKHYVAQYMLNSPPGATGAMDLAKMLAKIELIESLHDDVFTTFRQARAGLLHLSPRLNMAKGQLAASTLLALQLRPHIIHVVGYCEGDHAATASDVIESCEIVHGVLKNALTGMPEMPSDSLVQDRKRELLIDAEALLNALKELGDGEEDPFTSPRVLAEAIKKGILDAPHLRGNPHAAGALETRIVDGAVYPFDTQKNRILSETERLLSVGKEEVTRIFARR